jgi:TerC family integral membrane protein
MTLPLWFQVATFVVLGTLLLLDLAVVARRPHLPSLRESSFWVGYYVAAAAVFAVLVWLIGGSTAATSFAAGWLTEYSLSIDNLFVFVLIMAQFSVPRGNQQKVLMMGIVLSLVLRGACIVAGAAAIDRFTWIFYVFGGFLIYTATRLPRHSIGASGDYRENVLIRRMRRVLPITDRYDGARLITGVRGRRMLTPMVVVFLAIGSTDLLFAFDSIPAIFGLTQDPFVVFTATLFALMGLRQLYFLLGGLLDRLVYLSTGLAIILGFIGVKLVLEAMHSNQLPFLNDGQPIDAIPVVPIGLSLGVIVLVLVVTTVASLLAAPRVEVPVPAVAASRSSSRVPAAAAGSRRPSRPASSAPARPAPVPSTRPAVAPTGRHPAPRYHGTRD